MLNNNDQNPKTDDLNSSRPDGNEEQGQVQVLPPEERENFQGITIDTGDTGKQEPNNRGYADYEYRDPQKRVYVRHVNLKSGLLNRLALGLLIITVTFIALPFLLFIIIPAIFIILFSSLLRRR